VRLSRNLGRKDFLDTLGDVGAAAAPGAGGTEGAAAAGLAEVGLEGFAADL